MSFSQEPWEWVTTSGAGVDRHKLMLVLNNLEGLYLRANYGPDNTGQSQARVRDVVLETAVDIGRSRAEMTDEERDSQVTSVELCKCPAGYYGFSCQECDIGYYR